MAERVVNPASFSLIATRLDWSTFVASWPDQGSLEKAALDKAVKERGFLLKSVQLRWLLYPSTGLPRATFTVWMRASRSSLTKQNVASGALSSTATELALTGTPFAIVEVQVTLVAGGYATVVAYDNKGYVQSSMTTTYTGTSKLKVTGNQIARVTVAGSGTLNGVMAMTVKDFVAQPDWKAVEVVGLPVDGTWSTTGYPTGSQGPVPASLSPYDAAINRLNRGAPPFGWQPTLDNGWPAPTWTGPELQTFVKQLQKFPLPPIANMLKSVSEAGLHEGYTTAITISDPGQQGGAPNGSSSSVVNLPALGNLLLATSSDTYSSLGAGFGTALNDLTTSDVSYDYMVTAPHKWWGIDYELADFVISPGVVSPPGQPSGLTATQTAQIPPTSMDGPWNESAVLRWNRVSQGSPYNPRVAAYGLARYKPASTSGTPLLNKYPLTTGWAPFVPTVRADDPTHIYFSDGVLPAPSDPNQPTYRYAIAASDLFGRYGAWLSGPYTFGQVPVRQPAIQSVQLLVPDAGNGDVRDVTLQIDLAWDWSWRSPEKIELVSGFVDTPPDPAVFTNFRVSNTVASTAVVWLQFGGIDNPVPQVTGSGVDVTNIKVTQLEGAPADPNAPDTRRYRVTIKSNVGQASNKVQVNFAGLKKVAYTVFARGYEHLRPTQASAWSKPYTGRAFSPVPPTAPVPPELPIWSSLPDVEGTPRVRLSWSPGSGSIAGYVLYQASETALRQLVGMGSPEQTESYVSRLATLRTLKFSNGMHGNNFATLTDLRQVFTRVQDPLIPGTSLEVKLPRGNQVIQAFVITAMSENNMESLWPSNMKHFFAVATPSRLVPKPPQLEARADTTTGKITVTLTMVPGAPIHKVQLFRVKRDELASRLDHMGPPLTEFTVGQPAPAGWTLLMGTELISATFLDGTASLGWHNTWYRAVAWTADDNTEGVIGARSDASGPGSAVLPPANPPVINNLAIDQSVISSGSLKAVRIGWDSDAPVLPTALGPHKVRVLVESLGVDANNRPVGTVAKTGCALQQTVATAGPPAQPPATTILSDVGRLNSTTPTVRYQLWVNRPSGTTAGTRFKVRITLTDPLGRATVVSQEVNWT